MTELPTLVAKLTVAYDAWIVGSAANPDANLATVRDIDVMVPWDHWRAAVQLIPKEAKMNTFGGWKIVFEGITIDIWPDDAAWLFTSPKCSWMWHPRTGTRLKRVLSDFK